MTQSLANVLLGIPVGVYGAWSATALVIVRFHPEQRSRRLLIYAWFGVTVFVGWMAWNIGVVVGLW